MPSIDDFINHRWADAKEVLRKSFDADYVGHEIESNLSSNCRGTLGPSREPPRLPDVNRIPKQRLCSGWHLLLEDCDELVRQATILQTATDRLIADSDAELSSIEAGKRFFYHMHSWFIHANTLAERSCEVIKGTARVYVDDRETCNKLTKRHTNSIFRQVTKLVDRARHEYAHGTTRSWSSKMTNDDLWEIAVSGGLTPRYSQDEFQYPTMGEIIKSGRYKRFADLAATILDRLGATLHELEDDIAVNNAATLQP